MNVIDIICLAVVGIWCVAAFIYMRKNGYCGNCNGNCENCKKGNCNHR